MFQNHKKISLIVLFLLFSNKCLCAPLNEVLVTSVNIKYKLTVLFVGERLFSTKNNGRREEFLYIKKFLLKMIKQVKNMNINIK